MNRKRWVALLLTAALCVSFTSCLLQTGSSKPFTIDLIVKGTDADFWRSVNDGAQEAAGFYGATVRMYGPETEKFYMDQIGVVEKSIARRPDAIVLAAADYTLLAQPVQQAVDAGIPVVMVDSDVDNQNTVAYVGTDNDQLGRRLARELCEHVSGGEVGIVSFVQDSYPAVQRESGFRSAMEKNGQFTLFDTVYCESDADKAAELTTAMVKQNPQLCAVVALNAQSAEGAARALSELGSSIPVFAIDCTPVEAMYMEEGIVSVALLQNPYQMGYYSIEAACKHLRGEAVGDVSTGIYAVDSNTLFDDLYQQLIFPFGT